MICIYCGGDTRVINSRPQKRLNKVWRRRNCLVCKSTFTSVESIDFTGSISIRKGKQLQPFVRDKLLFSICDSLKHRKTAITDATWLTDTIISKLYPLMNNAMLQKSEIASISAETLKKFDKVAASHYQAFHPIME